MFIYADQGVARLLPLGISVSDRFDMLAEPDWSDRVAAALAGSLGSIVDGWGRCELHEVPAASLLRTMPSSFSVQSVSPVLDLQRYACLPARSGARCRLTRARRAAEDAGLTLDQPGADALDDLFLLHRSQWQARGESGVLEAPRLQAFHREAARALAATDTPTPRRPGTRRTRASSCAPLVYQTSEEAGA